MSKELYSTPGAICIDGLNDGDTVATKAEVALKAPINNPDFTGTVRLPVYTSTALPSPAIGGHIIWVSDLHAGHGAVCASNGTHWYECQIGQTVP